MANRKKSPAVSRRSRRTKNTVRGLPEAPPRPIDAGPEAQQQYHRAMIDYHERMKLFMRRRGSCKPKQAGS